MHCLLKGTIPQEIHLRFARLLIDVSFSVTLSENVRSLSTTKNVFINILSLMSVHGFLIFSPIRTLLSPF